MHEEVLVAVIWIAVIAFGFAIAVWIVSFADRWIIDCLAGLAVLLVVMNAGRWLVGKVTE